MIKLIRGKLAAAVFLLITILVLPGCVALAIDTEINPDGSGIRKMDVAIEETLDELLKTAAIQQGEPTFEEQMKKNAPKGSKFDTYAEEGKVHYAVSFKFENVEQLKKLSEATSKGTQGFKTSGIRLTKRDRILFAVYDFSEKIPASTAKVSPEQEKLAKAISLTYKLTLPGRIIKSNADKIEENSATWRISALKGGEVRASSRYIRWWVVGVVALLLLLIVVAAVFTVLKAISRRRASRLSSTEE
ncbi:MAG: DUF3153 domain-containing protein [Actinomycetota bacterium]|nr:DUF3153 domain-containing protein [Actinomycetota bacterium]